MGQRPRGGWQRVCWSRRAGTPGAPWRRGSQQLRVCLGVCQAGRPSLETPQVSAEPACCLQALCPLPTRATRAACQQDHARTRSRLCGHRWAPRVAQAGPLRTRGWLGPHCGNDSAGQGQAPECGTLFSHHKDQAARAAPPQGILKRLRGWSGPGRHRGLQNTVRPGHTCSAGAPRP